MTANKNPRNGWNSNPLQGNVDFTKVQNSSDTSNDFDAFVQEEQERLRQEDETREASNPLWGANSTATAKTAEAGRGEASKVVTDIISHAGTSDKVSLHHENVLPIDGLPNHVQVCLKHWHEAFQCPREYLVASVLAVASAAIGNTVRVKYGPYSNSVQLWCVLVGRSGINKSAPVKEILRPLRAVQEEYNHKYKEMCDSTPKEETPPPMRRVLMSDSTPEARAMILRDNPQGVLNFRDELRAFFSDIGRYNKSGEASDLLSIFNNDTIDVARKNAGNVYVTDPFMSMLGGMQPDVLERTFNTDTFMYDGLVQRFLFAYPDSPEIPYPSGKKVSHEDRFAWENCVLNLMRLRNLEAKAIMHLGDEAATTYGAYCARCVELQNDCSDDYTSAIYSKAVIYVLRLAGVVQCMSNAWDNDFVCKYKSGQALIAGEAMDYAVRCMEYFEATALMVRDKLKGLDTRQQMTNPELLRELCRRFDVKSQSMLAQALNLSPAYISQVLNGKK